MVSKTVAGPCDYQFEMIKSSGRNYRVPVLNNVHIGKVIDS